MSYPKGLKIYIDGEDCTYFIFGSETFDPDTDNNLFRDINITPYLRKIYDYKLTKTQTSSSIHTIEITAEDGNGRVECRVEVT